MTWAGKIAEFVMFLEVLFMATAVLVEGMEEARWEYVVVM